MYRFLILLFLPFIISCSVSRQYDPNKKFDKNSLQKDYTLLRKILEEKHPSLYWYTSKDSMDYYFDRGMNAIGDSMTELQFGWKVLAPMLYNIRCGHTSFMMSKEWNQFIKNKRIPSFPLYLKAWNDTLMVVHNQNPKDSLIKKGDFVHSINGLNSSDIMSTIFQSMVQDGYSSNVSYNKLSLAFPFYHRNVFGLYQQYNVKYSDSNGVSKNTVIPFYAPPTDSLKKEIKAQKKKKISRAKSRENIRSVAYDSASALITINSFTKSHLRGFLRRTFREIKEKEIDNIIIDLRFNGGGDMNNSVLLTKYLRNTPFRVADSAYALAKNFAPYSKYISNSFFNNMGLRFLTRKKSDGGYHFGYWERHTFKPKRKNHFDGKVFVLTNGFTFSASSLFCNAVKGQSNIVIAGEETGGGWYGNSGILIPTITLPHTHLRVRLPFFRLVQFDHIAEKGTGVIPDLFIGTDWRDILRQEDTKIKEVRNIISQKKE